MTIRKRDLDMSTFGFHAFSEIFMLWALTDFSAHVLSSCAAAALNETGGWDSNWLVLNQESSKVGWRMRKL